MREWLVGWMGVASCGRAAGAPGRNGTDATVDSAGSYVAAPAKVTAAADAATAVDAGGDAAALDTAPAPHPLLGLLTLLTGRFADIGLHAMTRRADIGKTDTVVYGAGVMPGHDR